MQPPHLVNALSTCGDIELNPGPTPLLDDDVLQALVADPASVERPSFGLRNKHVIQLFSLKEQQKSTWNNAVAWLRVLVEFPADGTNWAVNIGKNWRTLKKARRRLQSSNYRSDEDLKTFKDWEENVYRLPVIQGARPKVPPQQVPSASPSVFDIGEKKRLIQENQELQHANVELNLDNNILSMRQSPHKQALQNRREQRKSDQLKSYQKETRNIHKTLDKLEVTLDSKDKVKRKLLNDICDLKIKHAHLENDTQTEKDTYTLCLENDLVKSNERVKALEEELKQCHEVNATLIDAAITSRAKLAEVKGQTLKCFDKGKFSNDIRLCVWELLGIHVAQEKIPDVIKSVMHLVKTKYDRLPTSSTVRNIADEMLAVSQSQLQVLTATNNLNLQTDETPKFGQCYEAYVVNTDTQDSYLLGMRHMADKSAQTTLDTLKEILQDINDTCKHINNTDNIGYQILWKPLEKNAYLYTYSTGITLVLMQKKI